MPFEFLHIFATIQVEAEYSEVVPPRGEVTLYSMREDLELHARDVTLFQSPVLEGVTLSSREITLYQKPTDEDVTLNS